ncbi:MAG: hypothetical protein B6I34_09430 [Anaerolineaceae bacterium 4572_32.1]|nr:MAG: hypothetical protein B6I34_09430 [Anaerolineaceae bacterium 4572_32.1]
MKEREFKLTLFLSFWGFFGNIGVIGNNFGVHKRESSMIINTPASLRDVAPERRILLLPHCLRFSQQCNASYDRETGLLCEGCDQECPINQLKTAAEKQGFEGVCIAPGGSLAIQYIKKHQPQGIVAVACSKELEMGIRAVAEFSENGGNLHDVVLVTVPLARDGCVDTEVDVNAVLEIIDL